MKKMSAVLLSSLFFSSTLRAHGDEDWPTDSQEVSTKAGEQKKIRDAFWAEVQDSSDTEFFAKLKKFPHDLRILVGDRYKALTQWLSWAIENKDIALVKRLVQSVGTHGLEENAATQSSEFRHGVVTMAIEHSSPQFVEELIKMGFSTAPRGTSGALAAAARRSLKAKDPKAGAWDAKNSDRVLEILLSDKTLVNAKDKDIGYSETALAEVLWEKSERKVEIVKKFLKAGANPEEVQLYDNGASLSALGMVYRFGGVSSGNGFNFWPSAEKNKRSVDVVKTADPKMKAAFIREARGVVELVQAGLKPKDTQEILEEDLIHWIEEQREIAELKD